MGVCVGKSKTTNDDDKEDNYLANSNATDDNNNNGISSSGVNGDLQQQQQQGLYPTEADPNDPYAGLTPAERLEKLRESIKQKSCYYKGETNADGIPHGKGKMIYNNGNILEGTFVNGVGEGDNKNSTFTYANGDLYFGPIRNDLPNGHGKIRYNLKNIDVNKSAFHSNYGISLINKNVSYTGDVVDGKPEGFGTLYYSNYALYKGPFKDGRANGVGSYYYPPASMSGVSNTSAVYNSTFSNSINAAMGSSATGGAGLSTSNAVNGINLSHKKYYGEVRDDFPNGTGTITYYSEQVNNFHLRESGNPGSASTGISSSPPSLRKNLMSSVSVNTVQTSSAASPGGASAYTKVNINNINKYFGSGGPQPSYCSDDSDVDVNSNKLIGQYQGEVCMGLPHGFGELKIGNTVDQKGQFIEGVFVE